MSDSGKKRVKCGILGAFWGSFPRFFEDFCLSFEANWKIVLRSLRVRMSPEDGAGFLFVRGATVRGWCIFLWLSQRGKIFDSGAVLKVVL